MKKSDIQTLVFGDDVLPKQLLVEWIASDNLRIWGYVEIMLVDGFCRIQPPFDIKDSAAFLSDYYLRCMSDPISCPSDADLVDLPDTPHSRYEAAEVLASFLENLIRLKPETNELIHDLVKNVTQMYVDGDSDLRLSIETGFLEHVFEIPANRRLFTPWNKTDFLNNAHNRCLEWGVAHER